MVGVCANTVTADSAHPDRIPMGRLWLYCTALGIPTEEVIKAISKTVILKEE